MFGMSAERSEAQRTPRIDSGGTPPLRSLCTRKAALQSAPGVPEMIVTHGIYLQYITVKAAPVNKVTTATGVSEMIVTHGIYLQYITVKATPVNKVKTAGSECSV